MDICFTLWAAAAAALACSAPASRAPVVNAVDFSQRTIYHSPETPGYTAWVGLHLLRGGRLLCDFIQQTGPVNSRKLAIITLESRDGGAVWRKLREDPTGPRDGIVVDETPTGVIVARPRPTVLPDGTILRCSWATDPNDIGWIQRSTDSGRTWSKRIEFLPREQYRAWPTNIKPLRDGRLVLMAGVWQRGDGTDAGARMTKMMLLSRDKGLTWGAPIVLVPTAEGVCEESDFCELPNGDLFWVHRSEHYQPGRPVYSDRMMSVTRRLGDTFVPGPATRAPFPHSGYPAVLYTREGLILHLATDGVCWSADAGATWTKLDMPGAGYYPKAVQMRNGVILCVGHVGSDDYYGKTDQRIVQQTFRLAVSRGGAAPSSPTRLAR